MTPNSATATTTRCGYGPRSTECKATLVRTSTSCLPALRPLAAPRSLSARRGATVRGRQSVASKLLTTGGAAALLVAARRTLRNWGATKAECRAELPGDECVPDPATVITRAVTVEAPANEVWQWLVQIGQNRGGMYSYQGIENLLGLDIHNADRIQPEWQQLSEGDQIWLVRPGWLGIAGGLALTVFEVVEGRSIVLFEKPWHAVWSFHIHPLSASRCRLISRSRAPRGHGFARLAGELVDPVTLVMTRKMLLGIKARAERSASQTKTAEQIAAK